MGWNMEAVTAPGTVAESRKVSRRRRTRPPGAERQATTTDRAESAAARPPLPPSGLGDNAVQSNTAAEDATPADLLVVGRIVAAQGLGGELRVQPLSDFPERFTSPGRRWLRRRGEPARCWQLLSGRQLPGRELFVLRLAAIENRTAAEALVGAELMVDAADRPPLAEGEFHLLDLVGLEVRLLPESRPIGRVEDLIHAGQDLLEISLWPEAPATAEPQEGSSSGGGEAGSRRLIPFVQAIVPEVHPAEGWLGLTPPPGLLELKAAGEPGAISARAARHQELPAKPCPSSPEA